MLANSFLLTVPAGRATLTSHPSHTRNYQNTEKVGLFYLHLQGSSTLEQSPGLSSPVVIPMQIPEGVCSHHVRDRHELAAEKFLAEAPAVRHSKPPSKTSSARPLHSSLSQKKESLSRVPLRGREQAEDQREARTHGILRLQRSQPFSSHFDGL